MYDAKIRKELKEHSRIMWEFLQMTLSNHVSGLRREFCFPTRTLVVEYPQHLYIPPASDTEVRVRNNTMDTSEHCTPYIGTITADRKNALEIINDHSIDKKHQ